jgi:hypothetical protein
VKIISTYYNRYTCEARSAANAMHDASQPEITVSRPFASPCKEWHVYVYYPHSERKPAIQTANYICLAIPTIPPLQKRREAPRGRTGTGFSSEIETSQYPPQQPPPYYRRTGTGFSSEIETVIPMGKEFVKRVSHGDGLLI